LEKLAEELDFELIAVHDEVMTEAGSIRAAACLRERQVDVLLLQTAA